MLSETDIHYISGFLFIASGGAVERAVLGEKVLDEASGTKRDVDIVIKTAGSVGFIGVEVKDERRKLDVILVEQLCRKLADMPSLTTRSIISTSGYTHPAIRKARAHGVSCLTLVHASVPPFRTIDLSRLKEITVAGSNWVDGPHVNLIPGVVLSEDERTSLLAARVRYPDPSEPLCSVQELADRVASRVNTAGDEPPESGRLPVRIDVAITDRPSVTLAGRELVIDKALVTGEIEIWTRVVPLASSCYLADENGDPFVATAIVKLDTGLFGLAVSRDGQHLRTFHIPDQARLKRPIQVAIG